MEKSKAEHEKLSQQAQDAIRQRNLLDDELPDEEMREEVGRLRGEIEVRNYFYNLQLFVDLGT